MIVIKRKLGESFCSDKCVDCLFLFYFQANVVCKQMSFSSASSITCCSSRGLVPANFSYDNVACVGTEATLDACPHLDVHNCGPNEGLWVVCNP